MYKLKGEISFFENCSVTPPPPPSGYLAGGWVGLGVGGWVSQIPWGGVGGNLPPAPPVSLSYGLYWPHGVLYPHSSSAGPRPALFLHLVPLVQEFASHSLLLLQYETLVQRPETGKVSQRPRAFSTTAVVHCTRAGRELACARGGGGGGGAAGRLGPPKEGGSGAWERGSGDRPAQRG